MKLERQIRRLRTQLVLALTLSSLLFPARKAHPSTDVSCTVLTIEALNTNQGVDRRLSEYASIFREKPFATFDTFKLINRQVYIMPALQPVKLVLPKELDGSLKLISAEGAQLNLILTLKRAGNPPLEIRGQAKPGSPFFAAGLRSIHGVWIFGVVCTRGEFVEH